MPIPPRFGKRKPPRPKDKRGVGASGSRSGFWAGMMMGAATATGGFFAIKALEKAFNKNGDAQANPGPSPAQQRLIVQATQGVNPGQPPPMLVAAAKPPVKKRTIIEEMVEDLDD